MTLSVKFADNFISDVSKTFDSIRNEVKETTENIKIDFGNSGVFDGFKAGAKESVDVTKDTNKKIVEDTKTSFKIIENEWDNLTSSMGQSIEDNLFDFIRSGFDDMSGFFKKIGKDLLSNFTTPLAQGMSASIASALIPSYAGGGQTVSSIASSLGLSLANGQYSGSVNGTNVVLDTMGNVVSGGSALGNVTNIASMGSTLYNLPSTLGGIGSFISNPMAGISGLYGSYTSGLYNLGNSISGGLTSLGILESGATLGSLGGVAGITAGQSLAGAGLTGAFVNPATLTGMSTVAGSSAAAAGAGTTSTLGGFFGSALGTAMPWLAGAGALYALYSLGWSDWQKKNSGLTFNDDMFSGADVNAQAWDWYKKKSGFSAKERYDYRDLTPSEIVGIQTTFSNLQRGVSSLGGGLVDLTAGKYAYNDGSGGSFDESLSREVIAEILGVAKTFTDTVERTVIKMGEGVFESVTYLEEVITNNAQVDAVYEAWEAYAESIDATVLSAMQDVLASVVETRRSVTEWAFGDDELGLLEYRADYMTKDAEDIAETLGVDFAELTAENFLDKYNEAISSTFDPAVIERWNNFADVFMSATDAMQAFEDATSQMANTVIANATALAMNSYSASLSGLSDVFDINASIEDINSQISGIMDSIELENSRGSIQSQLDNTKSFLDSLEEERASLLDQESLLSDQEADLLRRQDELLSEQEQLINDHLSVVETLTDLASSLRDYLGSSLEQTYQDYKTVLNLAKRDYAAGNYSSDSFSNLSTVASNYANTLQEKASSRYEFEVGILSMSNEIEAITEGGVANLATVQQAIEETNKLLDSVQDEIEDISYPINDVENAIEDTNSLIDSLQDSYTSLTSSTSSTLQAQLSALYAQRAGLEQQRTAILETSQAEIAALERLLGSDSPIISALRALYDAGASGATGVPEGVTVPSNTEVEEAIQNNFEYTANGALLETDKDKSINRIFKGVLGGSSIEQYSLDYWRSVWDEEEGIVKLGVMMREAAHELTNSWNSDTWIAAREQAGFKMFADGGIVTSPTAGIIGEAGYPEAVIPLKNPNDPLNMGGLVSEIRQLRKEVSVLNDITEKQAQTIIKMNKRDERIYRETA